MAKIKRSYFPNEEYFFSNDESDIVTFVEMLKNRGCYIGSDWHIRSKKGGMMSKLMRNGYYMTNAQYNKKEYYFMEHRVIWVWHNGPIPKGLVINHKDYNRANNNIDNLEVLTQKENTEYSRINYKPCRGEKSPRAMFTNAQASAIKAIAKLCGMSAKSISNLVGKPYITVMRVINGQRYPDSVSYDTIMEAYPHIVDLTRNKSISPLEELKNYSMGLCGECGEAVDILKKNLFHGKELDKTELMLELGDILYYLVAICNVLGIDVSEVALNNNAKLLNRYKEGFSKDASNNRVEEQQRGVIDGNGDNR